MSTVKELFLSSVNNFSEHIAVVEALARRARGLKRGELLKAARLPDGGTATSILRELEESNFIRKYQAYGKKKQNGVYQLADFYSLFHLRFLKNQNQIDKDFWLQTEKLHH